MTNKVLKLPRLDTLPAPTHTKALPTPTHTNLKQMRQIKLPRLDTLPTPTHTNQKPVPGPGPLKLFFRLTSVHKIVLGHPCNTLRQMQGAVRTGAPVHASSPASRRPASSARNFFCCS